MSLDLPEMPTDAPEKRQFVVATCQEGQQGGELRQIVATSHEEAVALVAAAKAIAAGGVVYEAWPAAEPNCILKVTLEPHRPRRCLA